MIARTLQEMFKRYRRPGDVIFAAVFLILTIFLISQIGEQTKTVSRAKWFAQPSFWPTVSLYLMGFFAFLHWLSSAMSERIYGRLEEVTFWARSLEYVLYFLIYVVAVPQLGYLLSTILFSVFLTLRAGFRGARTILTAVLFGIIVTVLFRGFLAVKIPAGAVYEFLPDSIRAFALTYL